MAKKSGEKVLTIIWRDENYGRVNDAVAFRAQLEPHPSQTETTKLARLYRKNGFKIHDSRQCWMAEYKPADTAVKLVEALEEAGYKVENFGAKPKVIEEMEAERNKETISMLEIAVDNAVKMHNKLNSEEEESVSPKM